MTSSIRLPSLDLEHALNLNPTTFSRDADVAFDVRGAHFATASGDIKFWNADDGHTAELDREESTANEARIQVMQPPRKTLPTSEQVQVRGRWTGVVQQVTADSFWAELTDQDDPTAPRETAEFLARSAQRR